MESFFRLLAERARDKEPSIIRELLQYSQLPGMISLGGGYPNPETFLLQSAEFTFTGSAKSHRFSKEELAKASQYGPSRVAKSLEPLLIDWHEKKGGPKLREGELCVLNGSQEGLFILSYLLLETGDAVVLSEPSYPGAISAFSSFKASFVPIPLDRDGMDMECLEQRLKDREKEGKAPPKFIYTIPKGHNPGGISMSLKKRRKLLEIAQIHELIVLEDDPYELLRYDTEELPSLQSLDPDGRVIRLDSFSKIFLPGLRLGYVSAASEIVRLFELVKQSLNLHSSSFNQAILASYLQKEGAYGLLEEVRKTCSLYVQKRDLIVDAAREYLPEAVEFDEPQGGFFLWLRLPEKIDARELHSRFTESHKVLLVPGYGFSTQNACRNCMRASFATVSSEDLREGIARFSRMLEDY